MKKLQWVRLYITIPLLLIAIIFTFNFIVDPYSMTSYNLLEIPNKFARDDRKEKVAKLYTEDRYNNIIFGSSHVYTINPLVLKKYLGGRSYNAGVGTARIEDHLGFLLYLERIGKLPKNVLLGLDFYSFNQNVETNKYFLVNEQLNFMQKRADSNIYFSKFLSIDAIRASYKTLHNYLNNSKDKPRFGTYGTALNASKVFIYYPKKIEQKTFTQTQIDEAFKSIKTIEYTTISQQRMHYVQEIVTLCKKHQINYTFFITPLNGQLLNAIENDRPLFNTFKKFKSKLSEITSYYDFTTHNSINDNRFYFGDPAHTEPFTGNLILARIFHDNTISLPQKFGLYVQKAHYLHP